MRLARLRRAVPTEGRRSLACGVIQLNRSVRLARLWRAVPTGGRRACGVIQPDLNGVPRLWRPDQRSAFRRVIQPDLMSVVARLCVNSLWCRPEVGVPLPAAGGAGGNTGVPAPAEASG